ncbi:SBBP repeat-containing protein [Candidatus Hodarchaeum mangrovi]
MKINLHSLRFVLVPLILFTIFLQTSIFATSKISANTDNYIHCSFLGGSQDDLIRDIAIDSEGNFIVTGDTMSNDFPITENAFQSTFAGGIQDIHTVSGDTFISKFNKSGGLIWSSFLGGSSNDGGMHVVVDSFDNIFVVGVTNSFDFPTSESGYNGATDGFITKLAPNGTMLFSKCIGTTGEEYIEGCVLKGDVITLTGSTNSQTFTITTDANQKDFGGITDGTIVQIDCNNGSIIYSSFLGGNNFDVLGEISVNTNGNFILNGISESNDLPISDNAYSQDMSGPGRDFFIAALNQNLMIEYCSFFGGSGIDDSFGCTIDSDNNLIFSGRTWSIDFPITNAYQAVYGGTEGSFEGVDAFIAKIDQVTGDLLFSSYFGGPEWDTLHHLAVDDEKNVYSCGIAPTDDFPIINGLQSEVTGLSDIILLALTPEGQPFFGTYLGGNGIDHPWNMKLIDNLFYIVGHTNSFDFPVSDEAYQQAKNGFDDGFYIRFDLKQYLEDISQTSNTSHSTSLEFSIIFVIIIYYIKGKKNN